MGVFAQGHVRTYLLLLSLSGIALWNESSRVARAANVWDGGGANDNWGTATNWDNDLVPLWPQAITFANTTRLTPNNNLNSLTVNGITFDASAGAYVVGGNSFTLGGNITDNATTAQRINNSMTLTATRTVTVPTGGNLTIGGAISGVGVGITKVGDGKLTLLGGNSYSGPITIGNTTSNGGTVFVGTGGSLGNGANALRIGGFSGTTPAPGTGAPTLTGAAFTGNLDLTGNSATVASLVVSGDYKTLVDPDPNNNVSKINVAAGNTFTVTGNALVGGMGTTATGAGAAGGNLSTTLKVTGGGNLKFGSGAGGSFEVWNRSANNNNTANIVTSVFDASAAASFVADYGNGGQILIGASAGDAPYGTLIMGGNDTLISSSLQVGVNGITSGSSANRGGGTLRLGSTNLIRSDSIIVGAGKATLTTTTANGGGYGISGATAGSLMIFDNQAGAGQTAVFRAQDGVGRINSFTISDQTLYTSNGSTGGTGFVDFTGGSVDALINSLRIGVGKSGQNSASSTGTLIFSAGTIDANSIIIGQRSTTSAAAGAPATGTVTVGGGTLIAGSGGIRIADTTLTAGNPGATTGTLNIFNTGVVTTAANITGGNRQTTPLATSTINIGQTSPTIIPGGTLNMQSHNIGSYAAPITNLNFNSGSLTNAGTIAGRNITIVDGFSFTGAPNFVLSDGGTLIAPSPLTLVSGGGLGGGGTVNVGTFSGDVVAGNGSRIVPGSSTVPGTLQLGNLTLNGGSTVRFKLSENTASGNDLINAANLSLSGTVNLEVGLAGLGPQVGNVYPVLNYFGTLTGNQTNFNVIQPGSRPTFSVSTATPGQVQVTVGGNPTLALKYVGNVNANWDLNNTSNWKNPSLVSDKFFNLDSVTFDDTSTNLSDVQLVGDLFPGSVVVNASRNYKFAGTGTMAGGAITKQGTGTLIVATNNTTVADTTISGGTLQIGDGGTVGSLGTGNITNNATLAINRSDDLAVSALISGTGGVQKLGGNTLTLSGINTYTGATTVSGGTVVVTNATTLGSSLGDTSTTPGDVNVPSGSAIDLVGSNTGNGLNFGQKNFKIAGSGINNTGAITNSGATGQQNALQKVTLTGNATIGGTGRFDVRDPTDDNNNSASLDLGGFTLTKEGTNQVTLVHTNVTNGDIVVNGGIFSYEGTTNVAAALKPDNTPYTITYNTGTTLQVFLQSAFDAPPDIPDGVAHFNLSRKIVLNGEVTIRNNGSAVAVPIDSPITLNGNITLTANAATSNINLRGDINELGTGRSLTKQSANNVTLTGVMNYTGPTTVTQGVLQLGADNRINNASNLALNGGTFNLGGFNETMNQLSVATATSHIDMGFSFNNTLNLAASGNVVWNGTALSIDDWSNGFNHIYVGNQPYAPGSTTMGLSTTQLQRITFSGFSPGATLLANGELVPQDIGGAIMPYPKGDMNLNHTIDAGDIPALLKALKDLNSYQTTNHLFASDVAYIADVDGDNVVSNKDIQPLLDLVASFGLGSVAAVPEPSTAILAAAGLLAIGLIGRQRRRST
jgi:fibronectin-binding autotransporter adhesin